MSTDYQNCTCKSITCWLCKLENCLSGDRVIVSLQTSCKQTYLLRFTSVNIASLYLDKYILKHVFLYNSATKREERKMYLHSTHLLHRWVSLVLYHRAFKPPTANLAWTPSKLDLAELLYPVNDWRWITTKCFLIGVIHKVINHFRITTDISMHNSNDCRCLIWMHFHTNVMKRKLLSSHEENKQMVPDCQFLNLIILIFSSPLDFVSKYRKGGYRLVQCNM